MNLRQNLFSVSTLTLGVILALAACSAGKPDHELVKEVLDTKPVTTSDGGSTANSVDEYKREIGRRIQQVNSTKVYVVRPQALLRSVIVMRFVIDAQGDLVRSEIMRTNHDKQTEMSESWLFNNDGKFQVRSVALQQIDR